MNIFHKLTIETLKKNKTRTLVTIIGVILSTAMITAVTTFISSIQNYLKEVVIETQGDWYLNAGMMSKTQVEEVSNLEAVSDVAIIESIGHAKAESAQENKPYFSFAGFSKKAFEMFQASLITGRLPENSDEVIIPKYMMRYGEAKLGAGNEIVGSEIYVTLGQRKLNGIDLNWKDYYSIEEEWLPCEERTYKIVGIYDDIGIDNYGSAGYLFITVSESIQYPAELYLKLKDPTEVYTFAKEYLEEYFVIYHNELLRYLGVVDNNNFYTIIKGLGLIVIVLIIGGSVALIYNAFSISVSERTKQFGLLSSIGATKKQRRKMIWFEAFVVSIIGIPFGILAGIIGIGITLEFVSEGLKQVFDASVQVQLRLIISGWSLLVAAVLAFFTILLSAWIPSIRSSKISVMEAIRQKNEIRIPARQLKTSKLTYHVFKLEGMLASKNYKRNLKKYRSTVISLVLSIVLFISASSLVMYIKGSSRFVLGTALGDIYYSIDGTEEEINEIYEILKEENHITKSTQVKEKNLYLEIAPELLCMPETAIELESGKTFIDITIGILPDEEFRTFATEYKIQADDYFITNKLKGLVHDNLKYYDSGKKRYEKIQILKEHSAVQLVLKDDFETEKSKLNKSNVEIFLMDYISELPMGLDISRVQWNERMTIIIPETQYQKFLAPYFEESILYATCGFQTTNYNETYNNMEKLLIEYNKLDAGFLYNYASEVQGDKNTIVAVDILSYGFIILISLIAVANVFNTVSTNFQLRRREFAMLRSIGMSQKGFYRMMNYECLLCGSKAILYGLPLSFLVTYLIYQSILPGVSIQFLIPWKGVLTSIISVFLVVFLTMLYSMLKLRKENTIDALKNENL